jgi:acetylornithine/N-succinyldiaminopimelate aminotransferase
MLRNDFFSYQAQTTQFAAGFEVESAKGSYISAKMAMRI